MLKQILLISWRTLLRNRLVSSITIFGLAAGITSCILIFLFVDTELSFDKGWKDADRIYRVNEVIQLQDKQDPFALTSFIVGEEIKKNVLAVEDLARLYLIGEQTAWYDGKNFTVEYNYFADSSFFNILNFPFVQGDPKTALSKPKTVVISERLAQQIFGAEEPMGKLIRYARNSYTVTGIIKTTEIPNHLCDVDALMSMSSMAPETRQAMSADYMQLSSLTYLKVKSGIQKAVLEKQINDWSERVISPWLKENQLNGKVEFHAQLVQDIHFDTFYIYDLVRKGNKTYVIIFALVAVFLLLIACFNYMNLTTAQAVKRAREVAVKKVAGASRGQLARQFLGESFFLTLIAFLLSIALVELLLPGFNQITDNDSSLLDSLQGGHFWIFILLMLVLAGLAGGSYPAFYLARLQPMQVLRSNAMSTGKGLKNPGRSLGKILVILQFGISVAIITATGVVLMQLHFLRNHELGFDKENVVSLSFPAGDTALAYKVDAMRNELKKDPSILGFATGYHVPGKKTGRILFYYSFHGKQENQPINMSFADYDYASLLGLKVVQGRWFSRDFGTDPQNAYVINESCARFLGLKDPIGKELESAFLKGRIIGVVKDYNYASLHAAIEPMVFMLPGIPGSPGTGTNALIRFREGQSKEVMKSVEQVWKNLFPNHPVNYFFLNESLDQLYRKEEIMVTVLSYFAVLTVVISCLGLFALAAFSTEKRTKEIGIRKVMGASVQQIVFIILKEFVVLVLLSIVIAAPLTWYFLRSWLDEFSYRIEIPVWFFILTGIFALFIACATVIIHAAKAALSNPIKALRYE